MASSPTTRSLRLLRERGYIAETVERWIPGANIRRDLFGFLDILAVKDGELVGVQTTTADHLADRMRKAQEHANYAVVQTVMRVQFHGWVKRGRRWECVER